MKKKIAFLLAAIMTLSVLPTISALASSENHLTSEPSALPTKVLFVESNSFISAEVKGSSDIKYIYEAPVLMITLEDNLSSNEAVRLRLTNAKWFFRDADSTERFPSGLLGSLDKTYLDGNGTWAVDNPDATGGVYQRTGDLPVAGQTAADLSYELTVSEIDDATATVRFANGGNRGDTIQIPLVVRTLKEDDFFIQIDSGSVIKSGKYYFGSSKAGSTATEKPQTAEEPDKAAEDAMKADVQKALDAGKGVLFELEENMHQMRLSKDIIDMLLKADQPIKVTDNTMTVILPLALMQSESLEKAKNIEISLLKDDSGVSKTLNEALLGYDALNKGLLSNLYDISIKVDGKERKTFDTPMLIYFELKGQKLASQQKEKLTAIHLSSADKYTQIGGKMSDDAFEAKTTETGRFGVIISGSLVKINLVIDNPQYTLNGAKVTLDVAPSIIEGRTMVPIRFVAEALGTKVEWDEISKLATITKDSQTLSLKEGETLQGMDVAPVLIDNRLLVPIRYISEKLGAHVIWDETDKTIDIFK